MARGAFVVSRVIVAGAVAGALYGCATGSPQSPTRVEILGQIFRSSVQVVVERQGGIIRSGSGVMIGAESTSLGTHCLMLTSGHTLSRRAAADEVYALLGRHQATAVKARADVITIRDDTAVDLALLRVPTTDCFPARPGTFPALGDPIWIVAFPLGGNMTLAGGIVSQVSQGEGPSGPRFTVDASVSYGASGAGVFEAGSGRLLGLVEGFGTARVSFGGDASPSSYIDVPVPGMTYVTPIDRIRHFLRSAGHGMAGLDRGEPARAVRR